jgi:hypothetical protein
MDSYDEDLDGDEAGDADMAAALAGDDREDWDTAEDFLEEELGGGEALDDFDPRKPDGQYQYLKTLLDFRALSGGRPAYPALARELACAEAASEAVEELHDVLKTFRPLNRPPGFLPHSMEDWVAFRILHRGESADSVVRRVRRLHVLHGRAAMFEHHWTQDPPLPETLPTPQGSPPTSDPPMSFAPSILPPSSPHPARRRNRRGGRKRESGKAAAAAASPSSDTTLPPALVTPSTDPSVASVLPGASVTPSHRGFQHTTHREETVAELSCEPGDEVSEQMASLSLNPTTSLAEPLVASVIPGASATPSHRGLLSNTQRDVAEAELSCERQGDDAETMRQGGGGSERGSGRRHCRRPSSKAKGKPTSTTDPHGLHDACLRTGAAGGGGGGGGV